MSRLAPSIDKEPEKGLKWCTKCHLHLGNPLCPICKEERESKMVRKIARQLFSGE